MNIQSCANKGRALYCRRLQTTALGQMRPVKEISSGPQSHFVNDEKTIYWRKICDLVECNLSRNNHIT